MFGLLSKLVDAPSVSGHEESVREILKKELKPYVDNMKVDKVGNLITRKGKGNPKIMLAAHMDELGMMVKYTEDTGFIRFELLGGWDERILPGMKVKIHGSKGPVVGVMGTKPVHLQDKEEQKIPYKSKELFIDIGAKSRKDAEKAGISIGNFITRAGQADKLLNSNVTGYGLDNRAGCAVLIETMKRLKGFKGTVYGIGTVQEEIGLVGIRGSIFGIEPDVVLALDTNIAGDTPEIKPSESCLVLGEGPVLDLRDAISITNPKVKKWILDTAKQMKMNVQLNVMIGGATDASMGPMMREGVPSACIAVPVRYVHSPVEVADLKDMENTIKLTLECIKSAHKYF